MDTSNEYATKYTIANYKTLGDDGVVEFRVPSRFTSVKQTIRRYEFFYQMVDFAVNKQHSSLHHFCNAVRPILMSMYDNDAEKVEKTIALAKEFQKVINGGKWTSRLVDGLRDGGVPTQDLTISLVVADNTTSEL